MNCLSFISDVEVRLFGMDTPHAGHVQVKYNGKWGTICGLGSLTYRSAEVICRQLRQGPPVKRKFSSNECKVTADHGAETMWLSDLNCQGYEESIDECPHRGWGIINPEMSGSSHEYCSDCLICKPRNANVTGTVESLLTFFKKHLSLYMRTFEIVTL